MKTISKYIFIVLSSILFFISCSDDIDKPDAWPEWPTPSQPKIENAKLTALNGGTSIKAGDMVKFSANVSDEFNNLTSYEFIIAIGEQVIFSKTEKLGGNAEEISFETKFPFAANLDNNIYPTVTLRVINDLASGTSELELEDENNVTVSRPATPSKLYLIDDKGQIFELNTLDGVDYGFLTAGDISKIGQSYNITEKLTIDNKIDHSGLVWGMQDGKIVIIDDDSNSPIPLSIPEGDILEGISFNMYTFAIGTLLANPVELTFASSSLPGYKEATVFITEGQYVEFMDFEDNIGNMLHPDFFTDASANKAKFTGSTGEYKIYYNTVKGFIYIESAILLYPESLWICGTGLGFPKEPYSATTQWNWWLPHEYIYCKKTADNIFEATAYFKTGFLFKFFRQRNWGPEETAHNYTMEPSSWLVNALNEWGDFAGDFGSGSSFTSGKYTVRIDMNTKVVRLIKVD